jgi:uncharacterized protein YPO0396
MAHNAIVHIFDTGFDVTKTAEILIDLRQKIAESDASIKRLESEGDKALHAELEAAKTTATSYRAEQADLTSRIAITKREIGEISGIIKNPDTTQPGSMAMASQALAEYRKARKDVPWYKFQPYFRELVQTAGGFRQAVDRATRRQTDNDTLQAKKYDDFQDLLNKHKQNHDGARDFTRADSVQGTLLPWIEARIISIENTDLISRRNDLSFAWNQVRQLLQEDFIHRVSDRTKRVKSIIREIDRILEEYEFHRETYSFTAQLDPKYRPIIEFAERANTDEKFLDQIISGTGQASDRDVLDQIRNLVLGQDDGGANAEEIEKLADYRNWFRYSLEMTNSKTGNVTRFDHRMVKGSGGEIQTPFYVIMAVAISAIHHGRGTGGRSYLGPVLLDEAFSKLSPANARNCIEFFKEVGLQVIMAAPGGKRAVIDACCNCVLDLLRIGDVVYIDPEDLGPRLNAETIAADPDGFSIEDLRRFVDQAKENPARDDGSLAAE